MNEVSAAMGLTLLESIDEFAAVNYRHCKQYQHELEGIPGVRLVTYNSYFPHAGLLLPETEKATKRVLSLPTGTAIGPDEVSKICQINRMVVAHGQEARDRLQRRIVDQKLSTAKTQMLSQADLCESVRLALSPQEI
jgi:dTDP-4-amino-4,6-dideoxygalactose transaminase